YWKKTSGKGGLTYPDALDEALCMGWIDGIVKSVDGESYMQRWTQCFVERIRIGSTVHGLDRRHREVGRWRVVHAALDTAHEKEPLEPREPAQVRRARGGGPHASHGSRGVRSEDPGADRASFLRIRAEG